MTASIWTPGEPVVIPIGVTASDIAFVPTPTIAGINVQAAIEEVDTENRALSAAALAAALASGGSVQTFVGSGISGNDTVALLAAYNSTPQGDTLRISGIARITSAIVFDGLISGHNTVDRLERRVNIICESPADGIYVDIGGAGDGITLLGDAYGMNDIFVRLNVYGPSACCANAVVLRRVDRSNLFLNVRCGALAYAMVVDGCLQNRWDIKSSRNWKPPAVAGVCGAPLDDILIQKNLTYGVATNVNEFKVTLEGSRNGIVATAQPFEGLMWISGTIQGMSGAPLTMNTQTGVNLTDLWLEANAADSYFYACNQVRVGPNVQGQPYGVVGSSLWDFSNCGGVTVDGFHYGRLRFDSNCYGLQLGSILVYSEDDIIGADGFLSGGESRENIRFLTSAQFVGGGPGGSSRANLFSNANFEDWPDGASAAPLGTSLTNATVARSTAQLYPQGCNYSALTTVTVAGSTSGLHMTVGGNARAWVQNRWVSFMVPVYVAAGQPDVRIMLNNEVVRTVTTKDAWVAVRGGAIVQTTQNIDLRIVPHDGATYVTGVYYVGGCAIVNGALPPKSLEPSIPSGLMNVFAPSYVNLTNITSVASTSMLYKQIGAWVEFHGTVSLTPTAIGTVTMELSPPIASANIGGSSTVVSGVCLNKLGDTGEISAAPVNNNLLLECKVLATALRTIRFSGAYRLVA